MKHTLECLTNGGNQRNKRCVLPFIYKHYYNEHNTTYMKYDRCTKRDSNVNWCYTEVDSNGVGVLGKWGNCGTGCPMGKWAFIKIFLLQ